MVRTRVVGCCGDLTWHRDLRINQASLCSSCACKWHTLETSRGGMVVDRSSAEGLFQHRGWA